MGRLRRQSLSGPDASGRLPRLSARSNPTRHFTWRICSSEKIPRSRPCEGDGAWPHLGSLDVSAFVQRLELVEGKVTPKAPAQLTCASYAGLWRTYLVKCDCFNDTVRAYSERGWGLRLSFVNSKDGGRHLTWRLEARFSKRTSFYFA